jgi:hypothetical protein
MTNDNEFVGLDAVVDFALHAELMPGRPGFRSGVRPNHWIPGWATTFIGQLSFDDREWLRPGEKCMARASLIIPARERSSFVPGLTWHVCEANKIVGYCRIVEVDAEQPVRL